LSCPDEGSAVAVDEDYCAGARRGTWTWTARAGILRHAQDQTRRRSAAAGQV